jgi:phage FluMu gp28-like protein
MSLRQPTLSPSEFSDCLDKIVSREIGEEREYIKRNFLIKDGQYVPYQLAKQEEEPREKKRAPIAIVSVDPADDEDNYRNWLATNSGFIQGLAKMSSGDGQDPVELFDIQSFLIDCPAQFLFCDKTRQFGFSFIIAAKALAEAMLKIKHTDIFVSYNEEESKEKIRYAKELYESLPLKYRLARKLKYDNKTSLVFEKSGLSKTETRILSYPQRIIRGKGGDVHVKFDEFAHCIHARRLYTSAVPVLSRGSSSLWIGSSPAGKSGLFYEIGVNHENNYPLYYRIHVNWWDVPLFCNDVDAARKNAPMMETDDRIEKYGTERIKLLRKSTILEDFQQEYECAYLDESYSYFPWDLIFSCAPVIDPDGKSVIDYDVNADELSENDRIKSGSGIDFYSDFDEFMSDMGRGAFKNPLIIGYDVGRFSDSSEVMIMEEDLKTGMQIVRCSVTMKNVSLPDQRGMMIEMLRRMGDRWTACGVDYNGIGINIAEDLELEFHDKIKKLDTNQNSWKEEVCRSFKIRMQCKKIAFPMNRPYLSQIHSIKRELLSNGMWRFAASSDEKHHGDKFWASVHASCVGQTKVDGTADSLIPLVSGDLGKRKKIIVPGHVPNIIEVMKFNPYGSFDMGYVGNLPMPPSPMGLDVPANQFSIRDITRI